MPDPLLQFFHVISNLEIKKNGHYRKKKKKIKFLLQSLPDVCQNVP